MIVTNDTVLCNLCLEDIDAEEPSKATHYCNNCNKNLCDAHIHLHKTRKSTKDHTLTPLLNNNKQQQSTTTSTSPSINVTSTATTPPVINPQHYCKHHQGQVTDIYCKDCDDVICFRCALFNHKLHNYVDVNEIVKEEQEKIKKLVNELNTKKEVLLQRNKEVELTITKVNKQYELNKNEIKEQFNDLQNKLNNKREQLFLKLDKIKNSKLQSLQNEKQLLVNHQNNINNLCQLNNLNNSIDILQNKLKLEKEMKELNKLNDLNNLNEMNEFKLNINEDKNNLINLINTKLGSIEHKEIKNDQLSFNNNLQHNNQKLITNNPVEKNNNIFKNNINNYPNVQQYNQNNNYQTSQLSNNGYYNVNFDLIKFELISKFGGPKEGNGNDILNYPEDIIYFNNLIYIADYANYRILILDNFLNYKNEIKLNSRPISLAINSNYLFIGCINNIIYKYNLHTLQLMNEIKSNQNYKFNTIYGMTFDKDNNLYICNHNNYEIIILNKNNEFIRKFKINNNLQPKRILINNKNQIVITCSDNCNNEIQVYDKLENFILNTEFNNSSLYGVINDKNDNYIICDYKNNKLLLLDNEFKLKKEFKENLNRPTGITLNKKNNKIYIVENWGHCCKLFK